MANIKSFPNNQDVYIGAEDVMKWLHGRTSGVFGANGNAAVAPLTDASMAVSVSDGKGWISNSESDGVVWWNDNEKVNGAKLQLAVDAADGVLSRIDRVVVEWATTNYVDYPEIKILKGALSSTPSAPALTNNSTVRQISLARISIPAGTTEITSSLITDERLDASVCGLVTEAVNIDTSMMQSQFASLLAAIEAELNDLNAGSACERKRLQFTDTSVDASAFIADTTYEDFGYRAEIPLSGVLASMTPEIVFGCADALGGNFAPVAECYGGGVYIYASSVPDATTVIPTIICWKAVE